MRLAILVSGTGSILESFISKALVPQLVLADRPCRGLDLASAKDIPTVLLDRSRFSIDKFGTEKFDRNSFSDAVLTELERARIDLVALAGFGTILTGGIHHHFQGRMLNTHPSLLPAFPGWHAVKQAIEAGVRVTGTTVHIVVPEVDAGPIVAQEPVRVYPSDTEESLHERIKQVERELFPKVVGVALNLAPLHWGWWKEDRFYEMLEEEMD